MNYYQWRAFARDLTITCAGSLAMGLLLAMAADVALPKRAHAGSARELIEYEAETTIGTRVFWARGMTNGCKANLLGFYNTQTQQIVMCESNISDVPEMLEILKHETWHAAQFMCNGGQSVLTDEQIRIGLRHSDRSVMRTSYPSGQHRLEAEARTVSQLPTPNFLRGLRSYCAS